MSAQGPPPGTQLVSGEGVAYALDHAGAGTRLIAAFIDLTLQLIVLTLLLVVTANVAGGADPAALGALIILEFALVLAGYHILMEWLTRGRTLGKLALGLRAVRDDGGPIGFRQAVVRGLSAALIEKPGLFFPFGAAAGVLTMIFSSQSKRIGDFMAGTFVLNERGGVSKRVLAPQQFGVPQPLLGWAPTLDLNRVDDRLALAVRQFVVRAHEMTPAAQVALGEDLRARLEEVMTPKPPPGTPTPWVLSTFLAERRRRAEATWAPQYGPPQYGPPQYGPPQYGPPQYRPPQYGSPQYGPPPASPQDGSPPASKGPFVPPS